MRDFSADHRWLSINTATLRGAGTLDAIIEACARHGIRAISPWRDQVAGDRPRAHRASSCATHGLALSGYCRGGMFPAIDAAGRRAALDDNRRAVDEAKAAGGGVPGARRRRPARRARRNAAVEGPVRGARATVRDGIAATLEYARSVGMPLAIEPLHPMYAADRACVNTLEQALDLCDALDPGATRRRSASRSTSITSGGTRSSRRRSRAPGSERLLAFHVCDWLVPTRDLLNDRGMMGDGVVEIPRIRGWVEAAGFAGYSEVEIFSSENWWKRPAEEVLRPASSATAAPSDRRGSAPVAATRAAPCAAPDGR